MQRLTLPFDAIVYLEMTGHYWTRGGWGTVGMMVDEEVNWMRGNMPGAWSAKAVALGQQGGGQWETMNSKRAVKLAAGRHTITFMLKAASAGQVWFNGCSMDGFWFRAASRA